MNLSKKNALLERRIASLEKDIIRLKNDNKHLSADNKALTENKALYKTAILKAEEARNSYIEALTELSAIKDQYRQAINEARQTRKAFSKHFRPLLNDFKKQVRC